MADKSKKAKLNINEIFFFVLYFFTLFGIKARR